MLSKIERYAPVVSGVISLAIAWVYLERWSAFLVARDENISNAFGPVFDLATFSAGSLFAIYVLALSRAEGFLGRIFKTKTFRQFHGYVAQAIVLSVALSLWTAVYMVIGMGSLCDRTTLFLASIWVGMTIWMLSSVGRVVVIFLMMVGDRSGRR